MSAKPKTNVMDPKPLLEPLECQLPEVEAPFEPTLEQQAADQKHFQSELDKVVGSDFWIEENPDGSTKAIHFTQFASFGKLQLHFLNNSEPETCKIATLDGSVRAGKTRIAQFKFFFMCANPPSGDVFLAAGESMNSIYDNMLHDMKDPSIFGPLAKYVVGSKGANEIRIFNARVLVRGSAGADAEPRIRGLTLAGAVLDEATLAHPLFFSQLLVRLGFVERAQLIITTNPDGPTHWLKKDYLDKKGPEDGWQRWRFKLRDNPALSAKAAAFIAGSVPPGPEYERKINGKWAGVQGAVYKLWSPKKHIIKWEDIPNMRHIWLSIDYGIQHATSAILQGLTYKGVIIDIAEMKFSPETHGDELDEGTIADLIMSWVGSEGWLPPQVSPKMMPEYYIVDSAALSMKRVLAFKYGLAERVVDRGVNKDVLPGIQTCMWLLRSGNNLVSNKCQGLINEMTEYVWDRKASMESGEDIVKKINDDSQDAHRYGIMTMMFLWHDKIAFPDAYLEIARIEMKEITFMR